MSARVIQTQGCSSLRNILNLCSQDSRLPGSQTGCVPVSSGFECVGAPSALAHHTSSVISCTPTPPASPQPQGSQEGGSVPCQLPRKVGEALHDGQMSPLASCPCTHGTSEHTLTQLRRQAQQGNLDSGPCWAAFPQRKKSPEVESPG